VTAPSDEERKPVRWFCPMCGPITKVDEDHVCSTCGADTFNERVRWFASLLSAVRAEERAAERERCARIADDNGNEYRGASKADRRDGWKRERLVASMHIAAAIRRGA